MWEADRPANSNYSGCLMKFVPSRWRSGPRSRELRPPARTAGGWKMDPSKGLTDTDKVFKEISGRGWELSIGVRLGQETNVRDRDVLSGCILTHWLTNIIITYGIYQVDFSLLFNACMWGISQYICIWRCKSVHACVCMYAVARRQS